MRKSSDKKAKSNADVVKVPIDPTSEAVLLGAVVNDAKARERLLSTLSPDYFFGPGHALMWRALRELYRRGLEYSTIAVGTLAEGLEERALDEYVRSYRERPGNLRLHVERVRWNKARKDAAEGSVGDFLEKFRDPTSTPDQIRAAARKIAVSFEGAGDLRYLRSAEDVAREHIVEMEARRGGRGIYPFGLPGLDYFQKGDFVDQKIDGEIVRKDLEGVPRIVPGARPGDVTVITGESGHGKSTAMARVVLEMTKTRRVLWGAWDQKNGASLELLAALSLGFSRTDLMSGNFSSEDKIEIYDEMVRLGKNLKFFDLPFGREMDEERRYNRENLNLIHQYVAESGCDVFVADLFSDSLEQTGPEDEVQALKRIKGIASECECHIFLVHWLRHKGLADREDKRPTRDLVTGSGAWIGKADNVLCFFRPGLYAGADDRLECLIFKQRFGAFPLAVEFDWNGEYGSIENGRTLDVARPGEITAMDEFADAPKTSKERSKRKRV